MISVQQGRFNFSTALIKSFSGFLCFVRFAPYYPMINGRLNHFDRTCSIRPNYMHKKICDSYFNFDLRPTINYDLAFVRDPVAVHRVQCRLQGIYNIEHQMHACQAQVWTVWNSFNFFCSFFGELHRSQRIAHRNCM